jgi:hypothetical protein
MAEAIISPGVYTNENDQSAVSQGPIVVGAAIVGPTVNGTPYVPTIVTSYSDYIAKFGTTFNDGTNGDLEYFTSIAAKNYFENGGNTMLVTRITNTGTGSSALNSFASSSVPSITASVVGSKANVSLVLNYSTNVADYQYLQVGIPSPLPGNNFYFQVSPWLTFGQYYAWNDLVYVGTGGSTDVDVIGNAISGAFNYNGNQYTSGLLTASYNAGSNTLTITSVNDGITPNSNWFLSSSLDFVGDTGGAVALFSGGTAGIPANSFVLETLAWGAQMNNLGGTVISGALPSGSATNVRWEVNQVNYDQGTFTLLVRSGNDNNNQKNVLETWTNLSMDVNQPNYISRVIGNQKPTYTYSAADGQGYIDYVGDFPNASRYVRVANVPLAQYNTVNNNGTYQAARYSGSLPALGSGSVNGAFNGGIVDTNLSKFMFENIVSGVTNAQGFTSADYATALNLLANTDEYQFNLLLTPGLFLAGGNTAINLGANGADPIALCEGRADALAVVDPLPYGGSITAAATAANASNSSYGAAYWPWCQVFSSAMGRLVWVPASTLMGGVFAFTDEVSAPWFAPAGVTRGGIPNVVKVERKLSLNDRNTLYEDNVNPLATFPGEGVVVFGQKTLQQKASALDRVNVRRLLIALKGFIGGVARGLVFEQNTAVTRNTFLNQVNPYLDNVVQRQGLYAYKVVMDESNNPPSVVDRNQLIGQIYIQPTKTAEFIVLDFNILPTGVEFPA